MPERVLISVWEISVVAIRVVGRLSNTAASLLPSSLISSTRMIVAFVSYRFQCLGRQPTPFRLCVLRTHSSSVRSCQTQCQIRTSAPVYIYHGHVSIPVFLLIKYLPVTCSQRSTHFYSLLPLATLAPPLHRQQRNSIS